LLNSLILLLGICLNNWGCRYGCWCLRRGCLIIKLLHYDLLRLHLTSLGAIESNNSKGICGCHANGGSRLTWWLLLQNWDWVSWLLRIKFWSVANHGNNLWALADSSTLGSCELFLGLFGCWGLHKRIIGADCLILFRNWRLNRASLTQRSINWDINLLWLAWLKCRRLLNFLMMQKFRVGLIWWMA
jgi:hypothetical protein